MTVKTTTTHCINTPEGYISCENGKLYIVTEYPHLIYNRLGKENVLTIEKIGIGYAIIPTSEESAEAEE